MGEPTANDYREGRAYSRDPSRWPPAPIDQLADYVRAVAGALRITPEEWACGWSASEEIERLRRGER